MIPSSPVVVTPPAEEPVTLAEAKRHLRVDATDEDVLIGSLIQAAREWAENYCNRTFVTTVLRIGRDDFRLGLSDAIELPRGPVQSIGSVLYFDVDGVQRAWSSSGYTVVAGAAPSQLVLTTGGAWPITRSPGGGVQITYTAGYGNAAAVPASIKQAMLLLIGHWYAARENVALTGIPTELPFGAAALLGPHRIRYC